MQNASAKYTETDIASFGADVLEASRQQLVLVDFWADWCAPCKSLTPILENLVDQYQGKIKLVKVDTELHQELAGQFGIRSLPTVFLFKDGAPVDQFMGVQPESAIKEIIDKHLDGESGSDLDGESGSDLDGESGSDLERAEMAYDQDQTEDAKLFVKHLIETNPDNDKPKLLLLKWLIKEGEITDATAIADSISEDGREAAEYKAFSTALELKQQLQDLPDVETLANAVEQDGSNLEARFQLSQHLVAAQHYQEALDHLLEIIKRNRQFQDDAARITMIKIFELLGGKGELVSKYRGLLATLLN